MSVFRPRSFLQLVLLGFALVTLPLIIATINATLSVGHLADQSQRAVQDAVQVTQSSRLLVEHLIDTERYARQYRVLGDASLFDAYETAHQHLVSLTSDMSRLPLNDYQQRQLNILIEKEHAVFETLQEHARKSVESEKAIAEFSSLTALARAILLQSDQMIDRQLESMQQAAVKAQRILVWQALAVIPGTILFTTIFVTLISRPIRQIRQAIRRLGEGDFSTAVAITGPRDLETLGQGLDWLRCRLFDLEQAKRKFLGEVSHELKTPLTAIREGVELLAEGVVGRVSPPQLEIVQILQDKTQHLQELIENLLDFSMAHARHAVLSRQPVPLHRLIDEVATDHKPVMLSKDVSLDLSFSEVLVLGDDEKLRVVIDNLFSNAVKYSPDGSTIHVSLQCQDECAVLDVVDAGPGLDETDKDKIFEAFYQGESPSEGAAMKGNGLGLAIVREYLNAHEGTIELVDDLPSGAHFRVTLPCTDGLGASAKD
jgi:two-component system, NtrC family, sensor histidine kinase GlrK